MQMWTHTCSLDGFIEADWVYSADLIADQVLCWMSVSTHR